MSSTDDRTCLYRKVPGEESPSFAGQDAGSRPVEGTPRLVQQKITASSGW